LHYFTCHTGAIDICKLKATYLLTYLLTTTKETALAPFNLAHPVIAELPATNRLPGGG